jgi:hypothetical protein
MSSNGSASSYTPSATTRTSGRPATRLSSPLAMMIIIPLLVLISGLAVGWITRAALHRSVMTTAATALSQSAERTKREIDDCLEQATPVLSALRAWARTRPDLNDHQTVARTLLAIAHGRPGVGIVSISTPTGAFHAVEQRNQAWTYVHASVAADGSTPRAVFNFTLDRTLVPVEAAEKQQDNRGFDPRQRPYYTAAMRHRGRTWTDPYVFFGSGFTGITCAEPVPDPNDDNAEVIGVVAVDFDLESLGTVLEQVDAQFTSHSFLFTVDRVLVGLPRNWRPAVAYRRRYSPTVACGLFRSVARAAAAESTARTVPGRVRRPRTDRGHQCLSDPRERAGLVCRHDAAAQFSDG